MKPALAIFAVLVLASAVRAQDVIAYYDHAVGWVQCGPQGCYPPGYYCPPHAYPPYSPPQLQPRPNGTPTPPVGSPDTPQFKPSPPLVPVNPVPEAEADPKPFPKPEPVPDFDKWAEKIEKSIDDLRKEYDQRIKDSECNCDPQAIPALRAEFQQQIETLAASLVIVNQDIDVLQKSQPNYEKIAEEVRKRLSHNTPIRVYLPDGTLAGESSTNIFEGGSIDFTFNPRALLDATSGEQ